MPMFEEYLNNIDPEILKDLGFEDPMEWKNIIQDFIHPKPMPKPKTQWELISFPATHLDKKFRKRMNIRDDESFYQLCFRGEPAVNGIFGHLTVHTTKEENLDKGRYLILNTKVIDRYSDSTVEHCKLKSPFYLANRICIFDKERKSIIYHTDREFDEYLEVFGNIVVHTGRKYGEGTIFFNLDTMEKVAVLDNFERWEGSDWFFIRTPRWDHDKQKIMTIRYEDGVIEVIDEIKR